MFGHHIKKKQSGQPYFKPLGLGSNFFKTWMGCPCPGPGPGPGPCPGQAQAHSQAHAHAHPYNQYLIKGGLAPLLIRYYLYGWAWAWAWEWAWGGNLSAQGLGSFYLSDA